MPVDLPSSAADVEALITSAASSRASYIRQESGTITLAAVRRLLEKDLDLDQFVLDLHKALIRRLVDEILLDSADADALAQEGKKGNANDPKGELISSDVPETKKLKKISRKKVRQESEARDDEEEQKSGDSHEVDCHMEAPKEKKQKKESKQNVQKSLKAKEELSEEENGSHPEVSDDRSDVSEGGNPQKTPSKVVGKSANDKQIERLKKLIKACGLNVPPSIYKKAKQIADSKRDSFLINELEGILSRQGLSANPTEKEIKAAKRRIERAKDLEGIDSTNIINEPRGRRSTSQMFAPIYKAPIEEHKNEENVNACEDGVESPSEEDGSD